MYKEEFKWSKDESGWKWSPKHTTKTIGNSIQL
jgi:hypothetical protein